MIEPLNIDIRLYRTQYAFAASTAQFSLLLGGIGSGKSIAGAARALLAADEVRGRSRIMEMHIPNTGMVTAPTYNILRDATIPAFREVAEGSIAHMTSTPPINAVLINGSVIYFRSAAQPELLRGPSISWWWGDEAALYSRDVWRIMIGRLRQRGKLGYAWLTTTPKGRNWLYQEFVQQARALYAVYRTATGDNPFIDAAYHDMLKESYSGDFARQELDGDFVAFEGLVYSEFDRMAHVRTPNPSPAQWGGDKGRGFARVVAGVDWGYANPGVIVVYGVDSDGRLWGLHEEYARRRRIEEWAALAAQLQAQYGIETFFCDPSEPDFIAQFQQAGCYAVAANNDVLPGIQAVKNRLVVQGDGLPRLILSPEFVHTAAEFEQYQWLGSRDGLRDVPRKVHDHALDATRYACMGVEAGVAAMGAMTYAG